MSLTNEELLHLATLSRLRIDEGELETFRRQLDAILGYVGRLQAVQVDATSQAEIPDEPIVRPDVVMPSDAVLLQQLQAAFPDRTDTLLKVPGVFEKPKD